jgi:Fe-S-cluster containining protein
VTVVHDAGGFADWIVAMQAGMRTGEGIDVPCGDCIACCTSAQTIVIEPDELADLPAHAVVARPDGERALAVDPTGTCVLMVGGRCTAYDRRPRRCRTYDCRIFPATGLVPEDDKPAIAARAAAWRFREDRPQDRARRSATRLAVVALATVQLGGRATSSTQRAAAAVAVHDEFLADSPSVGP